MKQLLWRLQAVCDSSVWATVSNQVRRSSSRISRRLLTLTVRSRRDGSGSLTAFRKKLLLSPVAAAASSNPSAIRVTDRFNFFSIVAASQFENIDSVCVSVLGCQQVNIHWLSIHA